MLVDSLMLASPGARAHAWMSCAHSTLGRHVDGAQKPDCLRLAARRALHARQAGAGERRCPVGAGRAVQCDALGMPQPSCGGAAGRRAPPCHDAYSPPLPHTTAPLKVPMLMVGCCFIVGLEGANARAAVLVATLPVSAGGGAAGHMLDGQLGATPSSNYLTLLSRLTQPPLLSARRTG